MQTVFSTADVPAAEALTYFKDNSRKVIGAGGSITPIRSSGFYTHYKLGQLGELALLHSELPPVIACGGGRDLHPDSVVLGLPESPIEIETAGRSILSDRDNFYVVDPNRKYTAWVPRPFRMAGLIIPREALARRIPLTNRIVNVPLPVQGDVALLGTFVRALVRVGPSSLSPPVAALLSNQILDLTAAVLRGRQLGLPATARQDRSLQLRWLALQLNLATNFDSVLHQFRKIFLQVPREAPDGEKDADL